MFSVSIPEGLFYTQQCNLLLLATVKTALKLTVYSEFCPKLLLQFFRCQSDIYFYGRLELSALLFPCGEELYLLFRRAICVQWPWWVKASDEVLHCWVEDSNKRIKLPTRNFNPRFYFYNVILGGVFTPRSNFCTGNGELVLIPVCLAVRT